MSDNINYKIDNNGVCTISFSREPVNALSFNFLKNLKELFLKLESNKSIYCILIKSELNHFSAGADLKERKIMSKNDADLALDNFNSCFSAIENFTRPTICLINGYCLGGGAELSLACDIRVGSNDSIIGFPEVSIGIIPGAGGTQRLPKIIGLSNAKYWIYTAKKFTAQEAFDYGFLNFTTDKEDLIEFGNSIASEIIENAPIAVSSSKKAVNDGYNKHIEDGLNIERKNYNISLNTKDRDEALDAFMNKRKPVWRNE